jgi:hypothetical protein
MVFKVGLTLPKILQQFRSLLFHFKQTKQNQPLNCSITLHPKLASKTVTFSFCLAHKQRISLKDLMRKMLSIPHFRGEN